ncbi:MAG: hypothetical protein JNK72_11260 [Myxococcales bacterium]|nr:hypothetical protein [Myxococcales bacterium]
MIDRGALVLAVTEEGAYRGVHRQALDAMTLRGAKSQRVVSEYREALIEGEGVLEDLDQALALRDAAARHQCRCEVVVFEVPQEPAPKGGLPVVTAPPAEGLSLLGWDVIETLEPFWSPLAYGVRPPNANDAGLFASRADAERYVEGLGPLDEPLSAARVWLATP